MKKYPVLFVILVFNIGLSRCQIEDITGIPGLIDFNQTLGSWDGFDSNYVETAQTKDYLIYAQDYDGFSLLNKD